MSTYKVAADAFRYTRYIRPGLFRDLTELRLALASGWERPLVPGSATSCHPYTGLVRAEANIIRLSAISAQLEAAETGKRCVDALALLAAELHNCRLKCWCLLAGSRAAYYISVEGSEIDRVRRDLAYALQNLKELAVRQRRTLDDGGKSETVFRSKMDRSNRAEEFYELNLDRAKFSDDCRFNEGGEANSNLHMIEGAIYLYRADAWDHIGAFQKNRAYGVELDPAAVADLLHCRSRIAELHAELPAAVAAARVEWAAEDVEFAAYMATQKAVSAEAQSTSST